VLDEEPVVVEAFAALAGQMLADLSFDSPRAAAAIAGWRRAHGPG
jgi:hypothetical protein